MANRSADETKLIPTRTREQISRGSSYPLSASLISEALADVRQFDLLGLTFHARAQAVPLDAELIPFAGVGCRSRDAWEIWVSAVPSELAPRARDFAAEHGFRYLRAWLDRPRGDTWFLHWHRCVLAIDPITNEGILAEVEEQRLVEKLPPVSLPPASAGIRPGAPSSRGRR